MIKFLKKGNKLLFRYKQTEDWINYFLAKTNDSNNFIPVEYTSFTHFYKLESTTQGLPIFQGDWQKFLYTLTIQYRNRVQSESGYLVNDISMVDHLYRGLRKVLGYQPQIMVDQSDNYYQDQSDNIYVI